MAKNSYWQILAILCILVMLVIVSVTIRWNSVVKSYTWTENFLMDNFRYANINDKNIYNDQNLIYYGKNDKIAALYNTKEMIQKFSFEGNASLIKRFPKVINIGFAKCGTGGLVNYLRLHPSLVIPIPSEVKFFFQRYHKQLNKYLDKMPYSGKEQLTYEKSPMYVRTPAVPSRIFNFDPDIKIIVSVRNPIDRAVSDFMHFVTRKGGNQSFEDVILLKNGDINSRVRHINYSVYHEHVSRWFKYFNRDQIHILDADNFKEKPYEELQKVEKFIGIHDIFPADRFYRNDSLGSICYVTYDKKDYCFISEVKNSRKKGHILGRTHIHPNISTELHEKLETFFRPHNARFYSLVNRKFSWN